jgi:hypothetical protein
VLDAEGAVDKSRVDEFRSNNLTLKKQLEDLAAKHDGIDPDAVKTLLAEKAELEDDFWCRISRSCSRRGPMHIAFRFFSDA